MEFGFSEKEEAFRQEVRAFIDAELPPDRIMPVVNLAEDIYQDENLELHKTMATRMGKKGWLALGWPEKYGGKKENPILCSIFQEELRYRGAPGWDPQGVSMVGPLLIRFGSDGQKDQHLPPITRGETLWCEGYSEPESGSDMASIRTTAAQEGDGFILNGQKLWTSGAEFSDWCHLLARTDRNAQKKHQGLSYFLLDMKTPGITVRSIKDLSGGHGLAEVFFEDVRVPREGLLGAVGQGWDLALTLLGLERGLDVGTAAMQRGFFDLLVQYLKEHGLSRSPLVQQQLSNILIDIETCRILAWQLVWLASKGLPTSAKASVTKLFCSEANQRISNSMMNLLGSYGPLTKGSTWSALQGRVCYWYLQAFSSTIARGTSEIQRNILAWRELGLPRG